MKLLCLAIILLTGCTKERSSSTYWICDENGEKCFKSATFYGPGHADSCYEFDRQGELCCERTIDSVSCKQCSYAPSGLKTFCRKD